MIREITFYPELTGPYGLEPCGPIRDLGRIVVLVGANGAGKSRYLRLIQDMLAGASRVSQEHAAVLVDGLDGPAPPATTGLCIDLTVRPGARDDERRDPVRDAYRTAPEVVEGAARALFNAENPRLAGTPAVAEAAREAGRLDDLLAALLDKRVEPEVDMHDGTVYARLGGRRFDATELTSDERVLLTWAVLFHRHAAQIRDAVLILDEPEVHLHPAATARVFSRLFDDRVLGERGQVWIATRSPSVLRAVHTDRVLLVQRGALGWSDAYAPLVLDVLEERSPPPSRLAPPPLPVGASDLQNLRRDRLRYVDKTAFVADVLERPDVVLLFTRPRRFGKTLNQSALRYFLEKTDEDRSDLFRDLAIWQNHEARRHFQQHPVIDLSLKEVNALTWPTCRARLALQVADAFHQHRAVRTSGGLSEQEAERFDAILNRRADDAGLEAALRFLSEILARHHGRRVVILIDEYDTPIHSAYLHGYDAEAIDFFKGFLSGALKDNQHLWKGVVTGILRVAKESLFSSLNNFGCYSVLHAEFAQHFGFTEDEVADLLHETGDLSRQADLKAWYDGYRFGGRTLYNPWSVARYLSQKDREPRPYWVNTGSNELVKTLLIDEGVGLSGDLSALLSGRAIHKTVVEDMVLRDIGRRPDAVWSLLVHSGYLNAEEEPDRRFKLTIPNHEVRQDLDKLVEDNLAERLGGVEELRRLAQALLNGDAETVEELIGRFLLTSMSYHSAAVRKPEAFYEGLLLGLLAYLRPTHVVAGQENAGRGRADILITPKTPGAPGVVLELKTIKNEKAEEKALADALRQIDDKGYTAKLDAHDASPIHKFAAVFSHQRVRVKCAKTPAEIDRAADKARGSRRARAARGPARRAAR